MFTLNRDRLLPGEVAAKLLQAALDQPRVKALLSGEHFSVDGTLIQAWTSMRPTSGQRQTEDTFQGWVPRRRLDAITASEGADCPRRTIARDWHRARPATQQ